MGQGKGKNVEAVDFFKGMVCFNYNKEESVQDSTLERWNQLCEDVGRDVLEDACLLLAQRYQKTRVKKNGEITLVEQYLRDRIDTNEVQDGEFIFEEISKAARALYDFREGTFVLKDTNGAERPSLAFLRVAASIATCKEIEMVVLAFLMQYSATTDKSHRISISNALRKLESVALWMMLTKPKPKDRFQRCLGIMDEPNTICLTDDEKRQICDVMNDHDFGKPSDRKKAAAILERLNQHRFVEKMTMIQPMQAGRHIEHVLPQEHKKVEDWNEIWTQEDATQWKQRLGNLALLDQKSNSKIGNKPFAHKKEIFASHHIH